jgi:hypothetical protein
VLSALRHAIETQKTAIAAIAESLVRMTKAPKQKPAPRDIFDGLVLNMGPLSAPAPEPAPLFTAIGEFLRVSREYQKMQARGSPLVPYYNSVVDDAGQKIEKLRPGFIEDLLVAGQRQPEVLGQAMRGDDGIAPLIAAVERVGAEREEAVRHRQAEHAELAPVRERLLKERMEAWWDETYPYNYKWERSDHMRNEAKPVEAALKRDIEAMPAAQLRRIEETWAREDRIKKAAPAPGPAPRRPGPSPF